MRVAADVWKWWIENATAAASSSSSIVQEGDEAHRLCANCANTKRAREREHRKREHNRMRADWKKRSFRSEIEMDAVCCVQLNNIYGVFECMYVICTAMPSEQKTCKFTCNLSIYIPIPSSAGSRHSCIRTRPTYEALE